LAFGEPGSSLLLGGLGLLDRLRLDGFRRVGSGRVDGLERALGVLRLRIGLRLCGFRRGQGLGGGLGVASLLGGRAPGLGGFAAGSLSLGGLGRRGRLQELQVLGRADRRGASGALATRKVDAGGGRLEKLRVVELGQADVVAHDQHAHADVGQVEQALGEVHRHAHAAVRSGIARQDAGVQRDAGPGDALHERHVAVLVEVGIVDGLLLHDAEDAGRRLVAGRASRDRRLHQHLARAVVDGDSLRIEANHRQQGNAGALERHHVAAVVAERLAGVRVVVVVILIVFLGPAVTAIAAVATIPAVALAELGARGLAMGDPQA
jgi:hypothetical protein